MRFLEIPSRPVDIDPDKLDDREEGTGAVLRNHSE